MVKWRLRLDAPVWFTPLVGADGTIYALARGRQPPLYLYAISPDGSVRWRLNITEQLGISKMPGHDFDYSTVGPCLGADGTVYVRVYRSLCAVTPAGDIKWRASVGFPLSGQSLAIGRDGNVYLRSYDNQKNEVAEAFAPDGQAVAAPSEKSLTAAFGTTGPDGTVYSVASGSSGRDRLLSARDADGFVRWQRVVAGLPLVGADGTIYVAGGEGVARKGTDQLVAITPEGKVAKIVFELTGPACIDAADTLYFVAGSSGGVFEKSKTTVCAVTPEGLKWLLHVDGVKRHAYPDPEPASAPSVGTDGTLYLVAAEWLYALGDSRRATSSPAGAPQQEQPHLPLAHAQGVTALAFSGSGRPLASGGYDGAIKLWSVPSRTLVRTLSGQKAPVLALAMDRKGDLLASGSSDSTVSLWALPEGDRATTLKGHSGSIYALATSKDGAFLVSASMDDRAKVWSLPEGRLLQTLERHLGDVNALAIDPGGRLLATGSSDGAIRLWALPSGRHLKTIAESPFSVSAGFGPERTLVSGPGGVTVKLMSLPPGRSPDTERSYGIVLATAISPDGKTLATGHDDNRIRLWSLPDGRKLRTLKGHRHSVSALAFTPDGALLASGSYDKTVNLWRVSSGALTATLEGHTARVNAVAVSPDGALLASGSSDGTVRLWSLPDGRFLEPLADPALAAEEAPSQ